VDIQRPDHPRVEQMYTAEGRINDARAVQIGSVNASMFALVADGKNGMRVIQLISPENVPEHMGFSPKPNPILIATYPLKSGEMVAIGRGLDRDRVVDETGQQTVVFGRRGSRPFDIQEMQPFLRHHEDVFTENQKAARTGPYYRVEDVKVEKDANGKPELVTRSGASLKAPEAFHDPTAPEQPAATPGVPAGTLPAPTPGNEFMRPQDVQRLLRTLDPNAPEEPLPGAAQPLPSPAPTPASSEPANPFMQQQNVDRLLDTRKAPAAGSPSPSPAP
jgi:hypothetical protein